MDEINLMNSFKMECWITWSWIV